MELPLMNITCCDRDYSPTYQRKKDTNLTDILIKTKDVDAKRKELEDILMWSLSCLLPNRPGPVAIARSMTPIFTYSSMSVWFLGVVYFSRIQKPWLTSNLLVFLLVFLLASCKFGQLICLNVTFLLQ